MHSLLLALAAAGLSSVTLAAPAPAQRESFTIKQAPGRPGKRNLLKEYKRALAKHGHAISERLASVNEADWDAPALLPRDDDADVGSVANEREDHGVYWVSPIIVGGQHMMLQLDTGSSDLWVFGPDVPADQAKDHEIFDPAKSKTWHGGAGDSWDISYASGGGASGKVVGTDTVNMGGVDVQDQVVQVASYTSGDVETDKECSGIIGLGFQQGNTVQPKQAHTLMENIVKDLKRPVMAADVRSGHKGSYMFGDVDPSAYVGEIKFADIDSSGGGWNFKTGQFAVGDGKPRKMIEGATALMDTGTTFLVVDPTVAKAYYKQVKGAQQDGDSGMWTFPCDAEMPDLTLDVGGVPAVVPGGVIRMDPTPPAAARRMRKRDNPSNVCTGGLQTTAKSGDTQVYGSVFMMAQYTVFDAGAKKIGVAPHADY